ncbi:MAG: hypothetical protein AB7P00_19255 [Sandaracinaceae bacterium]
MEVEERPGYLFIVETGRLTSVGDVRRYQSEVDRIVKRSSIRRAIIDSRGEVGDAPIEARNAMWDWLVDPARGFEVVAFVLPPGVGVARVNMTALSRGANVRAFDTVTAAQRWLSRGGRQTLGGKRPSSFPPAVSGTAPTQRPPETKSDPSELGLERSDTGRYPRDRKLRDGGSGSGGSSNVAS